MQENKISFTLDSQIYPLEAIYSASYVFVDRVYVFLSKGKKNKKIKITFKAKKKLNKKQLLDLKNEFHNELLDYVLRVEIGKRTKKIREAIVGAALVSSLPKERLVNNLEEEGNKNYKNDPLGIFETWEKKHKVNEKSGPKNNK